MLLARVALLLVASGCTLFSGDDEPCTIVSTTQLGIAVADQTGNVRVLQEMGEVPLFPAPQGGQIALIAPRIRTTTEACTVQATAALRDMTTNLVIALEQRPLVLHRGADGWAGPPDPAELSELANVAVCPSSASEDIDGRPARIEVVLVDRDEAVLGMTSLTAVPTCDSEYCRSECAESF